MVQPPRKSIIRTTLTLGTLCLIGLAVLYFTQGRMPAEKIATALVMPTGLLWLLMLTCTFHLIRNRQKAAAGWMLLTVCTYSVVGSSFVSGEIARSLERPYLSINPLQSESSFDAIVLLGGGGSTGANGRLQANASGDRMILAAQLFHSGLTPEIICTGQRIAELSPTASDPAIISRDVLMALGVPETAITMLGGRNTTEEMDLLRKRFQESSQQVGLVTSAWHMTRALRLASKVDFHPTPLPADFRSYGNREGSPTVSAMVESIIPNPGAMLTTWCCCKEYLGMLVGR